LAKRSPFGIERIGRKPWPLKRAFFKRTAKGPHNGGLFPGENWRRFLGQIMSQVKLEGKYASLPRKELKWKTLGFPSKCRIRTPNG